MMFLDGMADVGLLIMRLALGIIFIYHGWPKLAGAKGMAQGMGKPSWTALLFVVGLIEFFGGLAMIAGFLTQLAGIGIAVVMIGAIKMKIKDWKIPFAPMDKMGWEYDFALLAMALGLVFLGAGEYSVDAALSWWP